MPEIPEPEARLLLFVQKLNRKLAEVDRSILVMDIGKAQSQVRWLIYHTGRLLDGEAKLTAGGDLEATDEYLGEKS